jgi:SAM-dependent methyltransferase
MEIDFGKTATDYARYRAGFPSQLFERLAQMGLGMPGQKLLDLGTGAGALARVFAKAGCQVTGIDPSIELLNEARQLDDAADVAVSYLEATAEKTGLPDAAFDVVTAAVCWHWFDQDRAAQEVRRVLLPGGAVVIVHFEWLAEAGSVAADTDRLMRRISPGALPRQIVRSAFLALVRQFKPEWVAGDGSAIHADRMTLLARNGFDRLESFSFDVAVPYSHEAWRGRLRSHAALGASRSQSFVEHFDSELAAMLHERHPADPLYVLHRVFVVVGRSPNPRREAHDVGGA